MTNEPTIEFTAGRLCGSCSSGILSKSADGRRATLQCGKCGWSVWEYPDEPKPEPVAPTPLPPLRQYSKTELLMGASDYVDALKKKEAASRRVDAAKLELVQAEQDASRIAQNLVAQAERFHDGKLNLATESNSILRVNANDYTIRREEVIS